MRAMLVDENKNLVWSEVPNPEVHDTEVLIEIHAAALNRADLLQRAGTYPSPKGCPPWMGLDLGHPHFGPAGHRSEGLAGPHGPE